MSQAEKPQIVVQDVLGMLKKGMTREEIREHYGLKKTDLKKLFQHPKLTGKKTHAKPAFTIVDEEADSNQAESVVDNEDDTQQEDFRSPVVEEDEEDLSGRESFGS